MAGKKKRGEGGGGKKYCMNMKLVPNASYYAMRVLSVVTHSLVICPGADTMANTVDVGEGMRHAFR